MVDLMSLDPSLIIFCLLRRKKRAAKLTRYAAGVKAKRQEGTGAS